MNRTKRILTHGWLGKALNVLTLGYYPYQDEEADVAIICLTLRERSLSTSLDNRFLNVELLRRSTGYTLSDRVICITLYNRNLSLTPTGERELAFSLYSDRDLSINLSNRNRLISGNTRTRSLTIENRDLDISMWRRRC